MIHGGIIPGTNKDKMVRRKRKKADGVKLTIQDRDIHVFCLDVDGFNGEKEEFIKKLPEPFQKADYVYQYSASYGINKNLNILKCHFFFWLEKPINNLLLQQWIKWMKKHEIKEVDPAVLTSNQAVYTQKRICKNASDPIETNIGYVQKEGPLKWEPNLNNKVKDESKQNTNKIINDFDLQDSITEIMTAENFHNAINSVALSLLNKKIPMKTVKSLLKGAMDSVENKDHRWQMRYDDIDRSIESAFEIVNQPTLEDILRWIRKSSKIDVKSNFAEKCIFLEPLDLTVAIQTIKDKIDFGVRDVQSTIRNAKRKYELEELKKSREFKSKKRKKKGIHEIICTPINNGKVAEKTCRYLAKSTKKPELFIIGGKLASVIVGQPKTIQQCSKLYEMGLDYPEIPIISLYEKPFYSLAGRIEKDIVYLNKAKKDIEIPTKVLHIIGEAESSHFKPLTGIIEHPFVDINWKLEQQTGYNKKTGLYTVLHHKLRLKQIESKKAYKYLTDVVFDEFPFSSELDQAVAVGALMTALQRPTIAGDSGMPGFGIVSPVQSSGKTTLAQLLSYSIYNRPIAAQSWSDDEEELGKHLLGIFQEGHSCVLFDNIRQGATIQSSRLANAMSNDIFGGRQLGRNKIIQVPSSVIWLFTGNGISFVGDFATRIYPININPKMESPDTRQFKRLDIGEWAMDNRKKILSAILSIILDGKDCPEIKGTSTRFKKWDLFVRRPLYKACGIDINEAIKKNQSEDLIQMTKANLIECLHKIFGNNFFSTKEVHTAAYNSIEGENNELVEAITDLVGKKIINTMSLGRYLGGIADNVLNNLMLTKSKNFKNHIVWKVTRIEK